MMASDPHSREVFVASCDTQYLQTYGPAFVETARHTRNAVHLHVVNPQRSDIVLLNQMTEHHQQMTYTLAEADISKHPAAVYASARFHYVADLLERKSDTRAFIMDIDSLFRYHFEYHPGDHPIGLYFRDPAAHGARTPEEVRGMRVLAVCWMWSEAAAYARAVSDYLKREEPRWFIDQQALADCYETFRATLPATDLSKSKIIDWEMRPYTAIWTGKGQRKHTNSLYKATFEEATRAFFQ